tara:strand:- start:231 stop:731 length:501 start_codon:yes stop_codon:yes gene_type:complete
LHIYHSHIRRIAVDRVKIDLNPNCTANNQPSLNEVVTNQWDNLHTQQHPWHHYGIDLVHNRHTWPRKNQQLKEKKEKEVQKVQLFIPVLDNHNKNNNSPQSLPHFSQRALFGVEDCPTRQVWQCRLRETLLNCPDTQSLQTEAPRPLLNLPGTQGKQEALPVSCWK